MPKALDQMTAAEKFADIIELRLDLIASFDLKILLNAANKPVIVTARSKLDGGQFKGSEEKRVAVLHEALETGVDYVDIEVSTQREYLQPLLESHDTSKIIISYHDFSHTPEDLTPLYETMKALPGEAIAGSTNECVCAGSAIVCCSRHAKDLLNNTSFRKSFAW